MGSIRVQVWGFGVAFGALVSCAIGVRLSSHERQASLSILNTMSELESCVVLPPPVCVQDTMNTASRCFGDVCQGVGVGRCLAGMEDSIYGLACAFGCLE